MACMLARARSAAARLLHAQRSPRTPPRPPLPTAPFGLPPPPPPPPPQTPPLPQVRAGLASLGLRSLDELIGRADLLHQRSDLKLAKTAGLNLAFLTTYAGPAGTSSARLGAEVHSNGPQLDDVILADKDVLKAIEGQGEVGPAPGLGAGWGAGATGGGEGGGRHRRGPERGPGGWAGLGRAAAAAAAAASASMQARPGQAAGAPRAWRQQLGSC
jgi:hypothetical protein